MELVNETLQPFGSRVLAEGRNILLPPELCFDMGLILHELATNSVKYGSLGLSEGTVRVTWSSGLRDDGKRVFRFGWDDPVSRPPVTPKGTGFGSKLIGTLIEKKWYGAVTLSEGAQFQINLAVPIAV